MLAAPAIVPGGLRTMPTPVPFLILLYRPASNGSWHQKYSILRNKLLKICDNIGFEVEIPDCDAKRNQGAQRQRKEQVS